MKCSFTIWFSGNNSLCNRVTIVQQNFRKLYNYLQRSGSGKFCISFFVHAQVQIAVPKLSKFNEVFPQSSALCFPFTLVRNLSSWNSGVDLSSHQRLLPECGTCLALICPVPKQSSLPFVLHINTPILSLHPLEPCSLFWTVCWSLFHIFQALWLHFSPYLMIFYYHNIYFVP